MKWIWGRIGGRRGLAVLGIVVLVAGLVGLAFDDTYQRGRADEITAQNVELKVTLDKANHEQEELQFQLQTCASMYQEAATQLQSALPIGQVGWCVGMSLELVEEAKQPIVAAAASYVEAMPPDVEASICAFIVAANVSEVRREIYVPVTRSISGGATESFVVYFSITEDGKLVPLGHYDVIGQEFVPAAAIP